MWQNEEFSELIYMNINAYVKNNNYQKKSNMEQKYVFKSGKEVAFWLLARRVTIDNQGSTRIVQWVRIKQNEWTKNIPLKKM